MCEVFSAGADTGGPDHVRRPDPPGQCPPRPGRVHHIRHGQGGGLAEGRQEEQRV